LPVAFEELAQFLFRSVEVEVSNKDVLQASCLRLKLSECG
jgi:hypothetical protein